MSAPTVLPPVELPTGYDWGTLLEPPQPAPAEALTMSPDRSPEQSAEPPPPRSTPCAIDACTCAWVPHCVGDGIEKTWYVARACGSCRILVTPARFVIPSDGTAMAERALDKAMRLNRVYGIGGAGWST